MFEDSPADDREDVMVTPVPDVMKGTDVTEPVIGSLWLLVISRDEGSAIRDNGFTVPSPKWLFPLPFSCLVTKALGSVAMICVGADTEDEEESVEGDF